VRAWRRRRTPLTRAPRVPAYVPSAFPSAQPFLPRLALRAPVEQQLVLVAHTHWDREWYYAFEKFRYRLVKGLDELLCILKRDPGFREFLLERARHAVTPPCLRGYRASLFASSRAR